jgi:hypothetical protein
MDMQEYVDKKYVDMDTIKQLTDKSFVVLYFLKDKTSTSYGKQPVFMVELVETHKQKEWTMGWNDIPKWILKHGSKSEGYNMKQGLFSIGKSKKNVDIIIGEPV